MTTRLGIPKMYHSPLHPCIHHGRLRKWRSGKSASISGIAVDVRQSPHQSAVKKKTSFCLSPHMLPNSAKSFGIIKFSPLLFFKYTPFFQGLPTDMLTCKALQKKKRQRVASLAFVLAYCPAKIVSTVERSNLFKTWITNSRAASNQRYWIGLVGMDVSSRNTDNWTWDSFICHVAAPASVPTFWNKVLVRNVVAFCCIQQESPFILGNMIKCLDHRFASKSRLQDDQRCHFSWLCHLLASNRPQRISLAWISSTDGRDPVSRLLHERLAPAISVWPTVSSFKASSASNTTAQP